MLNPKIISLSKLFSILNEFDAIMSKIYLSSSILIFFLAFITEEFPFARNMK